MMLTNTVRQLRKLFFDNDFQSIDKNGIKRNNKETRDFLYNMDNQDKKIQWEAITKDLIYIGT